MFKSFFMAGFECATGENSARAWIDQICATEHDILIEEDYARLREIGIEVAREGVRWPIVDRKGKHDLSSVEDSLNAAKNMGIQLILDLFHYGYPTDLDPFTDRFVNRFASYCEAVAKLLKKRAQPPHFITPVNEPSYFAWAGGEVGRFAPHAEGRGPELKAQLIRAAIAGIDAIRSVLPEARMVNADPVCRVCAPLDRPELEADAHWFNEHAVFEGWDMLAGRMHPEFGGSRDHLDIVGINYYWTNQWEHTRPEIPLAEDDPRCWPLRDLVRWVWHRYRCDIVITETSHIGESRGPYLRQLAEEIEAVLDEGIPLKGVCLYPILGMPEWHDQSEWARMGLWDLQEGPTGLERVLHRPSFEALKSAQSRLEGLTILQPQRKAFLG